MKIVEPFTFVKRETAPDTRRSVGRGRLVAVATTRGGLLVAGRRRVFGQRRRRRSVGRPDGGRAGVVVVAAAPAAAAAAAAATAAAGGRRGRGRGLGAAAAAAVAAAPRVAATGAAGGRAVGRGRRGVVVRRRRPRKRDVGVGRRGRDGTPAAAAAAVVQRGGDRRRVSRHGCGHHDYNDVDDDGDVVLSLRVTTAATDDRGDDSSPWTRRPHRHRGGVRWRRKTIWRTPGTPLRRGDARSVRIGSPV